MLLSPVSDLTDITGRDSPMRIDKLFVTWAQPEAGIARPAGLVVGRKLEIKVGAARKLEAYRFAHEDNLAGARVVMVPRGVVLTIDALRILCCTCRNGVWESQSTEATMDLSILEIGE